MVHCSAVTSLQDSVALALGVMRKKIHINNSPHNVCTRIWMCPYILELSDTFQWTLLVSAACGCGLSRRWQCLRSYSVREEWRYLPAPVLSCSTVKIKVANETKSIHSTEESINDDRKSTPISQSFSTVEARTWSGFWLAYEILFFLFYCLIIHSKSDPIRDVESTAELERYFQPPLSVVGYCSWPWNS